MTVVTVENILLVREDNDVLSGLLIVWCCDRIAVKSIRVRFDIHRFLSNVHGIIFGLGLTVLLSLLDRGAYGLQLLLRVSSLVQEALRARDTVVRVRVVSEARVLGHERRSAPASVVRPQRRLDTLGAREGGSDSLVMGQGRPTSLARSEGVLSVMLDHVVLQVLSRAVLCSTQMTGLPRATGMQLLVLG